MTRRFLRDDQSTTCAFIESQNLGGDTGEMDAGKGQYSSPPREPRPALVSHPSSSLPSTPYQRPRNRDAHSRSSSVDRSTLNVSPKSSHSDSNPSLSALRRRTGGCKYEAGMSRARRRVPYSLGPEKLQPESYPLKERLAAAENDKLSADMRKMYEQKLVPSPESEGRRKQLVRKLERLLNDRWPGHDIQVHVFGSSGNNLGTTESDVDICITTAWKELEHVCALAEFLAGHGMENVVCVSSAKVPIVKVWDPELQLACDMNVNNTVALENTELIKAYVDMDDRVRPLAMIIKYWTKMRILNDAALGGTLSSYTWICLIINFLQTRDPPVLPTLQQQPSVKPRMIDGLNVAFDKNFERYKDFGKNNASTLGELLFQFFRYYGHELDFEENVVSVRLGKIMPKRQKGWDRLQDNRLCVEEPFNISRNLGNTADDTSMRGIHLELRRAFGLISKGKLDACCEQYEPPKDESRTSEIFIPPVLRPVETRAPAPFPKPLKSGSVRGGRHHNGSRGAHTGGRRSSNPSSRGGAYLRNLPFPLTAQELQLQAQHQQHLLHDRLFQQYQYLQAQEQELRMQLQQQALLQGRIPSTISYPHIALPSYASQDDAYSGDGSSRASSVSRVPMSAPLFQQRFSLASPYLSSAVPTSANTSNPSSPHLGNAVPAARRYPRRSSVHQLSSGGSLRAQSQPARPQQTSGLFMQPIQAMQDMSQDRRSSAASSVQDYFGDASSARSVSQTPQPYNVRRPAQYIGYYVGQSPTLAAYSRSAGISPVPSHVGLAIQNGGLSPRALGQQSRFSPTVASTSPGNLPSPLEDVESERGRKKPSQPQELTIVSSSPPPKPEGLSQTSGHAHNIEDTLPDRGDSMTFSASTSEDLAFDTPSSSDDQSQAELDSISLNVHPSLPIRAMDEESSTRGGYSFLNGATVQTPDAQPALDSLSHSHSIPMQSVGAWNRLESRTAPTSKMNGHRLPLDPRGTKMNLGNLNSTDQLSPVAEVQTPPALVNTDSNMIQSARTRTIKTDGRNKQGKLNLATVQTAPPSAPALLSKPNGHLPIVAPTTAGNLSQQPSGWQTQKKKKKTKKPGKSENDTNLNSATGDGIPLDENLRKGG